MGPFPSCPATPTHATPNQATSPNKNPPFLTSKPLIDVLRSTSASWKLVQSQPVALAEVLKGKFKSDPCSSFLEGKFIENTSHWASLFANRKKSLDLPDPVVMALNTSPEVQQQQQQLQQQRFQQLFLQFVLRTAVHWQELSESGKADIKNAGLPEAVINDLNKAVRVGLLLPAFKYAEKMAFLNRNHFKFVSEAQSVLHQPFFPHSFSFFFLTFFSVFLFTLFLSILLNLFIYSNSFHSLFNGELVGAS